MESKDTENVTFNHTDSSHLHDSVPLYSQSIYNIIRYSPGLVVFLSTINIVEIVLTILGNLTVILTVAAYRQLWVPSNILLASLAVGDFAIGLILQAGHAWRLLNSLLKGKRLCSLHCMMFIKTMGYMIVTVSLVHLSLITLDRFAAIIYPLRYVTIITISRTRRAVVFAWTFSFVFGLLVGIPSPVTKGTRVLWFLFLLLTSLFIICLYCKFYCISRKHAKKIQEAQPATSEANINEERKGLITFGIVSMAMVICYIPDVILVVDEFVASPERGESSKLVRDIVRQFAILMVLFNSALNPLVYFFRSEKLRAYGWKLFKSICSRMKKYFWGSRKVPIADLKLV